MFARVRAALGSLHVRLLAVNALVLLVPIFGLEFARVFERELLLSLERDMRHQAVLVRRFLEPLGVAALAEGHEAVLARAARDTRTRVRVLGAQGQTLLDSHRDGPPEGEETVSEGYLLSRASVARGSQAPWPKVADRGEVRRALQGERSAYTRLRAREPSVLLFVTEPLYEAGRVRGVVYITRSTQPVMAELYRIRAGLQRVLLAAFVLTGALTLFLALSITRPLRRLATVAERVAGGETGLVMPVSGAGEVRSLARAFAKMTERLEQRMADTRAFAADVAHGFKSPLTSLRGAAELLSQGAVDDPRARQRFLHNIELDAERLDRLVTRLLELSRFENSAGAMAPVALRELIAELCERAATPDVAVELAWACGEVLLPGRRAELGTAFSNLLDNAVRYSPPGSRVRVGVASASPWLVVRIVDAGPGVPVAHTARIFERFFTTDADQGTGLGLSIVQVVLKSHGGSVCLEPRDAAGGGGATFVVRLPLPDRRADT